MQESGIGVKVLLVSVGGSSAPIIYTIDAQKPENVIFFCSRESRREVRAKIEPALLHRPLDIQIITTPNEQDLLTSVEELVNELPKCLTAFGATFADLKADFTGGTKVMAAATVLALADRGCHYSYVGGVTRDKQGLGVVVGGREQMLYADNPWDALGREPLKLFAQHFNRCRFQSSGQIAHSAADRSDRLRPLFQVLEKIAEGYRYWDNFDHKRALNMLSQTTNSLKLLRESYRHGAELLRVFGAQLDEQLLWLSSIREDMALLEGKGKSGDGQALLRDLLANGMRRAERENKFDDAVCRLYSAIEKRAKIKLLLHHEINNSEVSEEQIPESVRKKLFDGATGITCKLPLFKSFELLAALNDPLGHLYMQQEKKLKQVLDVRNHSLLAHGFNPVRETTYTHLLEIALDFCGLSKSELPDFPKLPEP